MFGMVFGQAELTTKVYEVNDVFRVSSNLYSFLISEDYNVQIEKQISKYFLLVSEIHNVNNGNESYFGNKRDLWYSFGGRVYGSETPFGQKKSTFDLIGNFFMLEARMTRINSDWLPSVGLSVGQSKVFNNSMWTEWRVGAMRFINTQKYQTENMNQSMTKIVFILSFGIGIILK